MISAKAAEKLDTVRRFLDLPAEALPSAEWLDNLDPPTSPWGHLRAFVADPEGCMIWGDTIILYADRDEWRDGVTITL